MVKYSERYSNWHAWYILENYAHAMLDGYVAHITTKTRSEEPE